MQYVERRPAALLSKFIECFWVVRDRKRLRRAPDRILPDGCPEWIVHAADVFARQVDHRWIDQPRSFIAGTLSRPWLVQAGRQVRTLGIRFRPGAAAALFDLDFSNTADCEVDVMRRVIGASALVKAVCAARSTRAMLTAAENHLLAMTAGHRERLPKSHRAVARIRSSRGRGRVEALARSLGVSRRTLERVFRRELGISPKQYSRIVRLNAVLEAAKANERSRIVDVALEAGYFDEAHLSRDFRTLTGRKLSNRETDGDLARHFTRPDRLRALLSDD